MDHLIVTRHPGAVQWLFEEHGIEGEVVAHATADLCRGRVVVGVLPYNLAALADVYMAIDLPNLPAEWRGKELSAEQLRQAGATLTAYKVTRK